MLSPLNNSEMDDYVQRLNAQLRKMSPQERAEVNQELRQHLEAQAKAHEELGATPAEAMQAALRSFGDPTKIGQQMYREWKQADKQRRLLDIWPFVGGLGIVCAVALSCYACLSSLGIYDLPGFYGWCLSLGLPALTGTLLGLCFPRRALCITINAATSWLAFGFLLNALCCCWRWADPVEAYVRLLVATGQNALCWLSLGVLCAYVTSARRRGGWYRLHLSDLKLRLR